MRAMSDVGLGLVWLGWVGLGWVVGGGAQQICNLRTLNLPQTANPVAWVIEMKDVLGRCDNEVVDMNEVGLSDRPTDLIPSR